ncbi:MAG: quinone oxidoreductase [Alphaproteobacteria bacterium]
MTHAFILRRQGGPEVLEWERVEVGEPGPGEVRLRQTAVGLNFTDVQLRRGGHKAALPSGIGMEAAGVVEAVGPGVTLVKPGDRVGYVMGKAGAYAEARLYPADRLIPLPDWMPDDLAAAALLKGLTAAFLLHRCYRVRPGQTVLVHAAAGGVGIVLVQWLKLLGATAIGTVGSEIKAALARKMGCDHVINYERQDFVARTRALSEGRGADVVYDSVGADTFMRSLDCTAPFGFVVTYGNAGGPIAPFDPGILSGKGSLTVNRPNLGNHTATRALTLELAELLFAAMRDGVTVPVNQRYPLADAAKAHAALEGRRTMGSTVLMV